MSRQNNSPLISKGTKFAEVAQLVERYLAKVEVAGSNPVFCSQSCNGISSQ